MLGFDTSDDCAVWRINEDQAVVLTLDFFTPVVDDPYEFGAIAAANSISDVYAMGATPIAALNILAFPKYLGDDVANEVLRGGADQITACNAFVVGTQIVEDPEPKYGMAVIGVAHPDKVKRNEGARLGDVLIYTKPLGMGIMHSAFLAGLETRESMSQVVESMIELNKMGAEAIGDLNVHAATDVTGFGLAGHLHEMLESSGTAAIVYWDALPMFERVYQYSQDGCRPGKVYDVIEWSRSFVPKGTMDEMTYDDRMGVLCDPQTSGGLLISLPKEEAETYLQEFKKRAGRDAVVIGEIFDGPAGKIFIK
jgi:selenide,water dikinase